MTSDSQTICSRCGFRNVPGDAFCGSCGAFLEWEGQPADGGATPAPAPDHDPDVPVVGRPSSPAAGMPPNPWSAPPAAGSAAAPPPAAAPTPVPAPAPAEAPGALVRCPACGIANTPGRTFCQSCGAKLEAAGRVAGASSAQIAAAVAAPNRPATPPAGPGAPNAKPQSGGGGGGAKWLVILVVLGVLVGGGVVVGGQLLKGPGPTSDASAGPSSSATAGATDAASGTPDGSTSAAPASAGPTPKPETLALTGATASSVVGDLEKFQPGKAIDGDPKTSWQEGNPNEKGEWIEVAFNPATVTAVVIRNGYGASGDLYKGNLRPRDVLISVGGAEPVAVRLKDTGKPQTIALTGAAGATTLRITIQTTYKSVKTAVSGTPFDDAAISEIVVLGVPGS